jgi:hypothetical protein
MIEVKTNLFKMSNYSDNQKVGELIVNFKGEEVYRENIYVKKGNTKKNRKNIIKKLIDIFSSLF